MNNFDKLHAEQDEFIRNTLKEDKIVNQPILDDFSSYFENSSITIKKISNIQKIIFFIIIFAILICVFLKLMESPSFISNISEKLGIQINLNNNIENDQIISNANITEDQTQTNTTAYTNIVENVKKKVQNNTVSNTNITENTVKNTTNTAQSNTTNTSTTESTSNIDLKELEAFIESYSIGIERISYDAENLESNTILLLIAKEYFDSHSSKSSLSIDTTYAATLENMHTFLTELTGKDYSKVTYISSYSNYIGYSTTSKTYLLGKDYSNITKEKYKCSDLKIIDNSNGLYSAKATVTRTIDKEKTNYDIDFTFRINSNYTYQKFNIESLKAKNTSFYSDNTVHLIDQSSIVEEDEN